MTGYIVMLRHPKGFPMPLVDEEGAVLLFPSEDEAEDAARRNPFGKMFGYKLYWWD